MSRLRPKISFFQSRTLESILRKKRSLLIEGSAFTRPSDLVREELEIHSQSSRDPEVLGNILLEYSVGPYKISLVSLDGEYIYLSELVPKPSKELLALIEKASQELVRFVPEDRDLDDYYIAEVLRKIYSVQPIYVDTAVYLIKERLRYGKIQVLLDDPYVEDISIGGPGPVWIRHKSVVEINPHIDMIRTNIVLSMDEVLNLQRYISTRCGIYLSKSNPIVDTQLPTVDGGHRVHMVDTIITGERPEISIRKKPMERITIELLIERKSIPRAVAEYLRLVLWSRGSIVITGPPSSGKTTVLKALLYSYIPHTWKVIIIEDTPEIDIPENTPWIRYTTYDLGALHIDQFLLAKAALRSSTNRLLVIGETRGAEAQVLAQALNMGMGAITTFHGGSSEEVVTRLMSPPIALSRQQISSIWAIVIMGMECFEASGAVRCVQGVDEVVPSGDEIMIKNIYSLGMGEPSLEDLLSRSSRLPPYVKEKAAIALPERGGNEDSR
ncbi:MAG: type II/IV secretion system ATPase subunit [Desulfurococcales archaeon]|jgi:flagellar protein FlaI|nr:type II/IV secretion system ATPase subunit [Desulfurococcales archaeon]